MRQETNNEMDLLLRRLARRQENLRVDEDHLDADELSSYAENALPAAARARYTEHLADCSSCRALIVGLSSSVGFVAAEDPAQVPPSGIRSFLASLFSPMVLRYSVPALGLIVVAVIGIGLWRRGNLEKAETFAPELQNQPAVANNQAAQSSPQGIVHNLEKPRSPEAAAPIRASRPEELPVAAPTATPSVAVTTDVTQVPPAKKPEQQPTERAVAGLPAPAPSVILDGVNVETEARKQSRESRIESAKEISRQRAYERAKDEDKRSDNAVAPASANAAAPSPAKAKNEASDSKARVQGAGASIAKRQRDNIEAQDKDDAEVRSVAGRRFRRQRGIWVDTAYDSSRNATSLTRGSEQYRALVADEPAIKTIADELDGEIIVVWKGRPYRIR